MSEKPTYELKGTLREDCMRDTATLEGFRALESDWRELFRWLMSVSGDIPFTNTEGKEDGWLSSLWENHVLVVLVEIIRKDLSGYVTSFVGGQGTSMQNFYTQKLRDRCKLWLQRLDRFIRFSHGYSPDSPAMQVAVEMRDRLKAALPTGNDNGNGPRRMPAFMDNRNQPYYRMLGALHDIQDNAEEYVSRIESGGDMDASLALLLTMVRNYCGIVSDFNARFSGWAEFYRREILHDRPKEAVQDSTYITVEPDRSKAGSTFSLPKGTEFLAGKAADGDDLLYALDEKAYIVPAVLSTVQAVFRHDDRLYAASLLSEENRSARLFTESGVTSTELEYGWLVTSRSLVLSEGVRQVSIGFSLVTDNGTTVPDLSGTFGGDTASFNLYVSSEEGWRPLPYGLEYSPADNRIDFVFTLAEGAPSPVPCSEDLHGLRTEYPAVKILFADRKRTDILPAGLYIRNIHIRISVEGIRSFTLRGDLGDMDPGQPFYPFGPLGERGGRLVFGHPEAAMKDTVIVSLKGIWNRLPEKGFREIYRHYGTGTPIDNASFKATCEWQDGDIWRQCTDSPVALFGTGDKDGISERAAITLNLGSTPGYKASHNRNGLYRLTLSSPEIGFGMNEYYRLYAEVMMRNAKEKEKNHIPVPEMPQVPLIADASFGYVAEETFRPGDACGSCLFAVTETADYEKYAGGDDGRMPLFVPPTVEPSLVLGITELSDTSRIRLYFSLRYVMTGDMTLDKEKQNKCMSISFRPCGGHWEKIKAEDILCEGTGGLTRSGFMEIRLPGHGDGTRGWLRLGFEGDVPTDTVVDGIWLNCFRVTAKNGDGRPVPAGSIVAPCREDSRIKTVLQPLPGYGGKPAETAEDAGIRERIRISTRGRAVCPGDYEALILERFPDIEKVCCIPSVTKEGETRIVVFPMPAKRIYPLLPLWKLTEMQEYISAKSSPFATTKIINPVYEPIDVRFKAVVRKDVRDTGEVRRRLKRRIRRFFCSWLLDGILPDLGMRFSHEALRSRIANDECITDTILLDVSGADMKVMPDGSDTWYSASCTEGVLYVRNIRIELVKNRSGVDEARVGNDFVIG